MSRKCPYDFKEKSRLGMVRWLLQHDDYVDYPCTGYPFAWDVKIRTVMMGGCKIQMDGHYDRGLGEVNDPKWDADWAKHVEESPEMFEDACSGAARRYVDGDYCSWLGNDQGQWQFEQLGRSGGHMCLSQWRDQDMTVFSSKGLPWTRYQLTNKIQHKDTPLTWLEREALSWDGTIATWLELLPYADLKAFYQGVVCLDADLSQKGIADELNYIIAFYRHNWEEDRVEPYKIASVA